MGKDTYELDIYFKKGSRAKFVLNADRSNEFLEWWKEPKGKFVIDDYELEIDDIDMYTSEYEFSFIGGDYSGCDNEEWEKSFL